MKIPHEVKVGGKTYKIEVTDNLELGLGYTGEIKYEDLVIRIRPQEPQKMECDFMHELTHAIFSHLGYSEHDEKKIDELANAFYMVVQDNPNIFQGTGVAFMKMEVKPQNEDAKQVAYTDSEEPKIIVKERYNDES